MSVIKVRNENGDFVDIPVIKGEKGDTPVKGVDYLTEEDIDDLGIAKKTEIPKIVTLTQTEYDALTTKDTNTFYFIKEV